MAMRILYITTLSVIAILDLASAWECSLKCGRHGYEKCMGEKNKTKEETNATEDGRQLLEPHHYDDESGSFLPETKHVETKQVNFQPSKHVASNLRGSSSNHDDTSHRRLSGFDFQVKMYWKEGFCWQEEWREREWCWQCRGDWPFCYEDEKIIIKWCNASLASQRWVYKPADETYGRFSPITNETLCFEGINATSYRLKPCDSGNTKQLFSGWSATPKFELIPYGQTERCLTQEHDPKNFEEVISYNCDTARADKTNYWGIYKPSGYYEAPSPMELSEGDEYCVIDLDLSDNLSIRNDAPFTSPDHSNIVMEQLQNGDLMVRDKETIVWQSGVDETYGNYYTRLQGDGNLLTFRGEVGEDRDEDAIVWKSRSKGSSSHSYFLGLSCDGSYIAIYQGTPNDIQKMIWSEDTTWPAGSVLSVADPIVFTPEPSQAPSLTPSAVPSNAPSAMPSTLSTTMPSNAPSVMPSSSPTSNPTLSPSESPTSSYQATLYQVDSGTSCSSNPDCAVHNLDGDCCPTSDGTFLSCCDAYASPTPMPSKASIVMPSSPPTPAPSATSTLSPSESPTSSYQVDSGTSCSSNPDCAVHNLDGDCCPASDGTFLSCCDAYVPSECKPYSLSLRRPAVDTMKQGWTLWSPDDDTLQLEQWGNGNLAIRDGSTAIWQTNQYNAHGQWYTELQENGNLATFPGEPGAPTGPPIWESGAPSSDSWSNSMFLGLDCSRRYLGVYKGTSDNPGERIWKIPIY